ncbi:hypothetical protein LIER_06654 [Lithospermum erythrorhizon]|uniref:Retroviral polymerase SH3-like domain-containing protein n=1 Tax=Lithospermum erythrorhizon TaxID=34254 RepID=A0AAV3P5B3_LITER
MTIGDYFDNDRLHEFLCGIHVERFGARRSSLLSQDPPPTLDRLKLVVVRLIQAPKVIFFVPFVIVRGMRVVAVLRRMDTPSGGGTDPVSQVAELAADPRSHRGPEVRYSPAMHWPRLPRVRTVGAEDRLTSKPLITNWIIDTGASNHVTGNLRIMFDIVDISASPIATPDGRISNAIKRGSVQLTANLGWKVFDLESREYFISRDVVFYENEFPFASSPSPDYTSSTLPNTVPDTCCDDDHISGVSEEYHDEILGDGILIGSGVSDAEVPSMQPAVADVDVLRGPDVAACNPLRRTRGYRARLESVRPRRR